MKVSGYYALCGVDGRSKHTKSSIHHNTFHKFYNGEMNEYNKNIKDNIPNPVSVISRYPQNIEKDIIEAAILAELYLSHQIRIFLCFQKKTK